MSVGALFNRLDKFIPRCYLVDERREILPFVPHTDWGNPQYHDGLIFAVIRGAEGRSDVQRMRRGDSNGLG